MNPKLSLCVPTNGIVEWVVPVIESIYSQGVDDQLFEVVISDNGENSCLEESISKFINEHTNCHYQKSEAKMFQNQIACFSMAQGNLIKFINHRMTMLPGSIKYLLDFEEKNKSEKPIVYFSNGVLPVAEELKVASFDEFVRNLSIYSSWSAGLCFWKEDFEKLPGDMVYNNMFPHISILFYYTMRDKYVIKNTKILFESDTDATKKGKYNLFATFAVDYPAVLRQLVVDSAITEETYDFVIKELIVFLANLYAEYVLAKVPCSYNLEGSDAHIKQLIGEKEFKKFLCLANKRRLRLYLSKIKRKMMRGKR